MGIAKYNKRLEDSIIKQEGFRDKVYRDIGGTLTIGYGFTKFALTGENGIPSWTEYWDEEGNSLKIMSEEEAKKLLPLIVQNYINEINNVITNENLTEAQFNALVDLNYRNGIGNLQASGVIEAMNNGDFEKARDIVKNSDTLIKVAGEPIQEGDEGYDGITGRTNDAADRLVITKEDTSEKELSDNMLPEVNIKVDKESDKTNKAPTIGVQPLPVDKNEELNKPDLYEQRIAGLNKDAAEKKFGVRAGPIPGVKGTVENPYKKLVPIDNAIEDSFYEDANGEIYHFIEGDYRPIENETYLKRFGKKLEKKLDKIIERGGDIIKRGLLPESYQRKGDFVPDSPQLKEIQEKLDQEKLDQEKTEEKDFAFSPAEGLENTSKKDDLNDSEILKKETIETPEGTETQQDAGIDISKLQTSAGGILKQAGKVLDSIGGPGAIVSYILGKKGLTDAMKEITPQKRAELSPLFYQHLRQSRELAKKGFHPAEERELKDQIDNAYRIALDNAVRGTGGDRAKFLAQSGILDSRRSSALLDFAAKDAELQRQNQKQYTDLMMFKENFDAQRSEKDRAEDLQMQLANKQSAAQFTGQAFSNVLAGLNKNSGTALFNDYLKNLLGGKENTSPLISRFDK